MAEDTTTTANVSESNATNDEQRDQFGRSASERTIELSSEAAELVNQEVTAGEHDTYDEALEHLITRGVAEIKRTRDAAAKLRERNMKSAALDKFAKLLAGNPALVNKPDVLRLTCKAMGCLVPEVASLIGTYEAIAAQHQTPKA